MEEYRYYIAIDENGSPYLEHSLTGTIKGTGQRAAKYLMKIGEGAQARYLYTQQEVQAYMNRAQRAAQAQRNKMEREAAHRRAQAQEAKQQVKTTAKNAASTVKSAGQKAVNTVKDKIGVDERQRAIETGNRLNEEYKKSGNKRTAAFDKAANEDAKAVSEYRNTLLGKAETALNTVTKPARRAMSKLDDKVDASVKFRDEQGNEISAKEAGRRAGEAVKSGFKSTTERMKDEFRKKKDEAVEKAKDASYDAREAVEQASRNAVNAVMDKTGLSARAKYENAKAKTQRLKDQAEESRERHGSDDLLTKGFEGMAEMSQRKQNRAEAEYKNTPLGKASEAVENAVGTVKDAAKNGTKGLKDTTERMKDEFRKKKDEAVEKAKGAIDNLKEKASDAIDKAKGSDEKTEKEPINIEKEARRRANQNKNRASEYEKETNKLTQSDRSAAENASKRTDAWFGETSRLADKYEQRYGKDWKNKLTPEEEEAYKKAMREFEKAESDSVYEWKKYGDKVKAHDSRWTSEYGTYDKNDPDFSDENLNKATRLGDTDFFTFKRPDGRSVIIEEDMKWVLPEGIDGNDPIFKRAAMQFGDHVSSARSIGSETYTAEQWEKDAKKAIDDAIKQTGRNKSSGR